MGGDGTGGDGTGGDVEYAGPNFSSMGPEAQEVVALIESELVVFISDTHRFKLDFPPDLSGDERRIVHWLSAQVGRWVGR